MSMDKKHKTLQRYSTQRDFVPMHTLKSSRSTTKLVPINVQSVTDLNNFKGDARVPSPIKSRLNIVKKKFIETIK